MNKIRKSERFSRLLALVLSGLFYILIIALGFIRTNTRPPEPFAFNPTPMTLSFSQIALQAAEPQPEVQPQPVPAAVPVLEEIKPVPVEPEAAEVVAPPVFEEPKQEPSPSGVKAQVTQAASAMATSSSSRNKLLVWVREQIEKEKYYPQAARNAGYEGQFRLLVKVGVDGKILEAAVLDGRGHPLLRRSLEKIMARLPGRDSGLVLDSPTELLFDFEFDLNPSFQSLEKTPEKAPGAINPQTFFPKLLNWMSGK